MRVLVTGGTGSVGRAAVQRLVGNGHEVRVIGRREGIAIEGAEYRSCDINDFDGFREQVWGMEGIVHLAAIASPMSGSGQEIFRVNCSGTFNVYQAAAEEGIVRIVNASSINALGFNYGLRSFPLHYFPIDEEHPVCATDPYSFSKQVAEQTADYFWRRDGISSVSLRLPAVYEFSEERASRWHEWNARFHQAFGELLALPEHERKGRVRQAIDKFDALRPLRSVVIPREERRERWSSLREDPDLRLLFAGFGRSDFWASIDARDSAQAIEKGLLADYQRSHALFVNDRVNGLGVESETLARVFFPDVRNRKRPLVGIETLVSIDKARALIGFEPEHSIERWMTPEPTGL